MNPANPSTPHPSHHAIALRAAELWRQRGYPAGRDMELWLEAERQLLAEIGAHPKQTLFHDARSLRERVESQVMEHQSGASRSPTSITLTP